MRLPRQPMPKRVGSSAVKITSSMERRGLNPSFLQNANRFETAQHADASVIEAGIGNGVDVRAGADRRERRIAAFPARKGVADCVFAHGQARFFAQALHVGAGAHVRLAEDDARHHRRLGLGDLRQRHQLRHEAVDR